MTRPTWRAFARRSRAPPSTPGPRGAPLLRGAGRHRLHPYCDFTDVETFRASACLSRHSGFCVAKASLLTRRRAPLGIPARIGFADVRNHLCTPRLRALMGTDTFVYHGYTDLYLDGRWVKATPLLTAASARVRGAGARVRRPRGFTLPAHRRGGPPAHGVLAGSRHSGGRAGGGRSWRRSPSTTRAWWRGRRPASATQFRTEAEDASGRS